MQRNQNSAQHQSSYDDFEVEIIQADGQYVVHLLNSRMGTEQEATILPFDKQTLQKELSDLKTAVLLSSIKHRSRPSEQMEAAQKFGAMLFDSLFPGNIRTAYNQSRLLAKSDNKGLRLKIRINTPELAALPWEYLFDRDSQKYLTFLNDTSIIRYLETRQLFEPFQTSLPLRILGMAVNPKDLGRLDVNEEKRRIKEATEDLCEKGFLELQWVNSEMPRDSRGAIRTNKWQIFHFIGHGNFDEQSNEGCIVFSDEQEQSYLMKASDLADLIGGRYAPQLVILNACESGRGGPQDLFSSTASILIRQGIPAVLAMQYEISDYAAIKFAHAFYAALSDGLPVDIAVTEARMAIYHEERNSLEWGSPILYMGIHDGNIFNIENRSSSRTRYTNNPNRPNISDADNLLDKKSEKNVKYVSVELIIDRRFDEFSDADQERLKRIIAELLSMDDRDVEIPRRRSGSVLLNVKLPQSQVVKLFNLVKSGQMKEYKVTQVDLTGVDLSHADLGGADLRDANLFRANLSRADLSRANLERANLNETISIETDFSYANLNGTSLLHATLRNANLNGSELVGTNFSRADLTGAKQDADFGKAILEGTKGIKKGKQSTQSIAASQSLTPEQRELVIRFINEIEDARSFSKLLEQRMQKENFKNKTLADSIGLTSSAVAAWRRGSQLPGNGRTVFLIGNALKLSKLEAANLFTAWIDDQKSRSTITYLWAALELGYNSVVETLQGMTSFLKIPDYLLSLYESSEKDGNSPR